MRFRSFFAYSLFLLALWALPGEVPVADAQGYAQAGDYFSLTEQGNSTSEYDYVYERGPAERSSPLVSFLSSKLVVLAIFVFAMISYSQGKLETSTISFGVGLILVLLKHPLLLLIAVVFVGSFYAYNFLLKRMAKKDKTGGKDKGKKKDSKMEKLEEQVADLELEVESLRAAPVVEKKGAAPLLTNSSTGQHER